MGIADGGEVGRVWGLKWIERRHVTIQNGGKAEGYAMRIKTRHKAGSFRCHTANVAGQTRIMIDHFAIAGK